jgi:hypothetical protein
VGERKAGWIDGAWGVGSQYEEEIVKAGYGQEEMKGWRERERERERLEGGGGIWRGTGHDIWLAIACCD